MRRVSIRKPGGYDRLEIEEAPDPRPGEGEVLVEVAAAGVNFADCIIRMGYYESAKELVGWPITPGFEIAGHADGEPVVALTRFGGYASHVAVPRAQVFPLPSGWELPQAAGFPTVFLTAYYALFEQAHVRAGETVLVHSAAGGVGGALVQLAKIAGAEVVAVVGAAHKVETARGLGADHVIDKSTENLWRAAKARAPAGYDVILDANGLSTLRQSYEHVAPMGRLVVYGFHSMFPRKGGRPNVLSLLWGYLRTPRFNPFKMSEQNRSVLAFNLSYLFEKQELLADAMRRLLGWVDEGKIRPPHVTPYPLEKVADAHRDLESGNTVGKLVLVP
jgi:NADPH:quinone reductase-like Zn-dependent oxidoreductase